MLSRAMDALRCNFFTLALCHVEMALADPTDRSPESEARMTDQVFRVDVLRQAFDQARHHPVPLL